MKLFLSGLLLLFAHRSFSQGFNEKYKYSSYEIGFSNAYFLGKDLPLRANQSISPGISFSIMTRQSPRITNGIKFTLNFPTSRNIGRKDSLSDYSFIYYQTRIHKYEFYLMTDLIQHRGRYQKRPDFIPYLYTGIGWIKMKQTMRYGLEDKVSVQNLTNTQYDKRSLVLPIGLGLRYKLTNYMDISLEVIYNYTFTKQLDLDYLHQFRNSGGRDSYLNVNLKLAFF